MKITRRQLRQIIKEHITFGELLKEVAPLVIPVGVAAALLDAGGVVALTAGAYNAWDQFSNAPPNQKVDRLLTSDTSKNIVGILKSGGFDAKASNVTTHDISFLGARVKAFEDAFGGRGTTLIPRNLTIGTNEDSIRKIIRKCGSQYGLAEVALFWPQFQNSGDDDLLSELRSELGSSDFLEFVVRPIITLPYAIKDGRPISEEEFTGLPSMQKSDTPAEGEKYKDLVDDPDADGGEDVV